MSDSIQPKDSLGVQTPRLYVLDWVRGIAIVMMMVFHGMWNLAYFGYIDNATMFQTGWNWFGNLILSTFLFVSGFSQYWSWRHRFNQRSFFKRLAILLLAAYGITLATYIQNREMYIFHGVLHHMAYGSLILLALRRAPVIVLAGLAVLVALAPSLFTSSIFNHQIFWGLGLSTVHPASPDFVPMTPWFWIMLVGAICGKTLDSAKVIQFGNWGTGQDWLKVLAWMGKYSIWIYLIHQPILFGLTYLYSMVKPSM